MCGTANGHINYLTEREIGLVTIEPTRDIVVGSYGTWTLTYTVGIYGLDVGGGLKIGTRRMSDWGKPQFDDPKAPNYVTVRCSVPAKLGLRYDPRGHIRPFRATIVIDVEGRSLYPGDQVAVVYGDRSGGSPGIQAQSFPESVCEFGVFVDPFSSGVYLRVPQVSPPLRVVSGSAESFVLQAPSKVTVGAPFRVKVHGSDVFGNPAATEVDNLVVTGDPPASFSLKKEDGRVKWVDGIRIPQAGIHYLHLRHDDEVLARSNPILVSSQRDPWNLYWGDTQAQTASTVGAGTVEEFFQYARDLAGIDFCAHQANDFMVTDEAWDEIRRETKRFHEPGRFITFLGYEWSGTAGAGGDRNVLFQGNDGPLYRSSSWQLPHGVPDSERATAGELHESLRKFIEEKRQGVLLIPHVGGRRAELDSIDTGLEPIFEICSCHGIFEWWLREALERGYRIGLIAASDDHTCRPGLTFPSTPEMAIRGGLAAVYAEELTRDAIWEALASRRCYATTGERIIMWVEADGHPMGAEFTAQHAPRLTVKVIGTNPIEEISIFNRSQEVFNVKPNPPSRDARRLRFVWTGARGRDRNRYTVWDGKLTLSKGKILSAQPLNMYAPKEGIAGRGPTELSWRSITAGHHVGILVEVDAPDEAQICFATGPATFDVTLSQVRKEDIYVDAGGEGQAVSVSTLHSEGDKADAEFDFVEEGLKTGNHVYYVRVVQADFHRAWSSPIYVDLVR